MDYPYSFFNAEAAKVAENG